MAVINDSPGKKSGSPLGAPSLVRRYVNTRRPKHQRHTVDDNLLDTPSFPVNTNFALEATVDPTTYTFAPWACERASGRANATSPQRLNQLHQREKRNSAKQSDNEFASTGWAPMAQWPIPRTRTRQRSRYPFARPSSRPRQIEVQHHASTPIAFHANGTRKESISNGSEIWRLGIGPERFKKAWLHERRGVLGDICAPIYQAGEH